MTDNAGYAGQATLPDGNDEANQIDFFVRQILNKSATCALVSVQAVDPDTQRLKVVPMVGQIDGAGNIIPHGTIHDVPYVRIQGGANAVIIDPQPGDIGICVFAAHDISTVKATRKAGGPGSRRRFDWADALFVGGVLNGVPTQFVRFDADGITITSPNKVTVNAQIIDLEASGAIALHAPNIVITGDLAVNGDVTVDGAVGSTGDFTDGTGLALGTHVHEKVTIGTGKSGGPVAPPPP